MILLGINESGKSNILEAISLFTSKQRVRELNYKTYCNKQAKKKGGNISIICELQCEKNDNYKKELVKIGLSRRLANSIKIKQIGKRILIGPKSWEYALPFCDYELSEDVFENYVVSADDTGIEVKTSKNFRLKEYEETKVAVRETIEESLRNIFESHFPEVIFWKPSEEKYLINKGIELNEFMVNPDISIPLKNCFIIAGIENIDERISSTMNDPALNSELCSELGNEITKHINEVWEENETNIEFKFLNGYIHFLVEEKNGNLGSYSFNQRSDGFKHFVSFLLNLSASNKSGQLENKIILIDEPEMHLHPSSQKYLRNELLKIAENNLVIFATHSVFMVDKKNLDRHISVKKDDEVTDLLPIEKNDLYKEEVLYKSLGTSILEHINENVLILEGKTDRNIFDLYKIKFENEIKSPNLSLISADGCTKIIKYTKFFNTKLFKGFVLTDSDVAGQQAKNDVLETAEGYNKKNVFEINDVLHTQKESTLEDLFDSEFIIECVKKIYNVSIDLDISKPFFAQIKPALYRNNNEFEDKTMQLKEAFLTRITGLSKEILKKQKYFEFFKKLQKKLYDAPAN